MTKKKFIPAIIFIALGILLLIFPFRSLTFQLMLLGISFLVYYFFEKGPLKEENFIWLLLSSLLLTFGSWTFLKQFAWFSNAGVLYAGLSLSFLIIFAIHTFRQRTTNPHLAYWPVYCSFVFLMIAVSTFFSLSIWAIILLLIGVMMLFFQN